MKLEARSVPVYLNEGKTNGWTPYTIRERPDGQVRVSAGLPTFTTQVKDFSQQEFMLPVPWVEPVLVTQETNNTYKVGEIGELHIFDSKCVYVINVSKDKKILLSAAIPPGKKDAVSTGLAVVGASLHNSGFSR